MNPATFESPETNDPIEDDVSTSEPILKKVRTFMVPPAPKFQFPKWGFAQNDVIQRDIGSRGISFPAIFGSISRQIAGSKLQYVTATYCGLEKVSIPHVISPQERKMNERVVAHVKGTDRADKLTFSRPPLVLSPGDTITLSTFDRKTQGERLVPGALITISRCSFTVAFATKSSSVKDKFSNDKDAKREIRKAGDPFISVIGAVTLDDLRPPYEELRAKLKSSRPPPETILETTIPEYLPESILIKPPENGVASTFQMIPTPGIPLTPDVEPLFDTTVLTNEMLLKHSSVNPGFWVEIFNPLVVFDSEQNRGEGPFANMPIPEQFVDGSGPLIVMAKGPVDGEEESGKESHRFVCTDGEDKMSDKRTKTCIRSGKRSYLLYFAVADKKIVLDVPVYSACDYYGIWDYEAWKQVGPQCNRATRALCFVSMSVDGSVVLLNKMRENYEIDMAYSGTPTLVLDYMTTFSWAGLRVDEKTAFALTVKRNKQSKDSITRVQSKFTPENTFVSQLTSIVGARNSPSVSLLEFTGDLAETFKTGKWAYFVVPYDSILATEESWLNLEDPTSVLSYQGYALRDDIVENSKYVTQNWLNGPYSSQVEVRAVFLDAVN